MPAPTLDVTVVIPCYNRWPHVQNAITSVLDQTHDQTRCIVVDDASTDGSFAALEQHYGHHPRVTLLQLPENRGQSAARNVGVQHAETRLVCFLDSDDRLYEDAVATRLALYREDPDFWGIAFGSKRITDHDRVFPDDRWKCNDRLTLNDYLACRDLLHTNTVMLPTAHFLDSGGFDESLRNQEDIELFLRLLTRHEARYSGARCCSVEAVDTQRARHDLPRIIDQGSRFTSAVTANTALMQQADPKLIRSLLRHDIRVMLNALYKSRRSSEFRRKLREALRERLIDLDGKLAKRYLLSYLR